jgi:hypothetical protein
MFPWFHLYRVVNSTFIQPAGTKSRFCAVCQVGENIVIGRQYLVRQATTLIVFARSTNNPDRAAILIEKAAEFLARIDEVEREAGRNSKSAGCKTGESGPGHRSEAAQPQNSWTVSGT